MTMLPTYFPSPPQGVWHLGPLPIRAYALFIITGIVVALIIGDRRWVARGGQRGVIYDIALWVVPFGLIGGRLYHLATDWRTYWGPGGAGLGAAFRIWDGGLGIWGAVALGVLGAWIGCRRHGMPLPAFLDAVAPGIILAQAIGRLGNYFNQELYGRETTLPWGLEIFYRRDPSGYIDPHSLDGVSTGQLAVVVQPTFLYELIWNVLVFVVLIYLDRKYAIGHGRLFATYVALYCVGRFWVELMRDDTATHIAGIRINSFTSTFVFIGAVVFIVLAPKGREDPESLRGKNHVADTESEPEVEPAEELASVAAAAASASASAATGAAVAGADDGAELGGSAEPDETAKIEAIDAEAEEPGEPAVEEVAVEEVAVEEVAVEEPAAEVAAVEEPEAEPDEAEAQERETEAVAAEELEAATEPEAEEPEAPEAEAEAVEPETVEAEAKEPEAATESETEAVEPEAPEAEAEAEEPETVEAEAEEPEAEPEAEEPEAEAVEEPQREEPAAAAEESAEPELEATEPESAEPELEATEPEAEEPEVEEAEVEEPEAEEPEAETAAAETDAGEAEEPAEEAGQSEPGVDVKSEERAAEKPAASTPPAGGDRETRRRWPLRRRSRR
ncbi:prolipoprotein diacylglyceryl transferase [Mycobacterium sp. Aquia_216]|uniref:prolipoprotein diacylglyceryl transferase n=1 Tax=Mycobacterium sp. Aquia_216 TaxID=2991729 RepID=UPI00227D0630|nr:prolipoprotein diacylglyceryl transferase [Mycobacterium sp. Aquia_216]WAJ47422.1 prolipoprotein diacylglyceryl transferase [Mycobacterium sp. Aquia_216]